MAKRKGQRKGNVARPDVRQVTSEEALKFIRKMQESFETRPRTQPAIQEYLARFKDAKLKEVGRRVQGDLLLRPARTVKPGDLPVGPSRPARSRKKTKASRAR